MLSTQAGRRCPPAKWQIAETAAIAQEEEAMRMIRLVGLVVLLVALSVGNRGETASAASFGSFDNLVTACQNVGGYVWEPGVDPEHRWCNGFEAIDCPSVAGIHLSDACHDYCCAGAADIYMYDNVGYCFCEPCGEGDIDPDTGLCNYE